MLVSDVEQAKYYVVQFEDESFYTNRSWLGPVEEWVIQYKTENIHRAQKQIFDWQFSRDLRFQNLVKEPYKIVPVRAKIEYEIIEG